MKNNNSKKQQDSPLSKYVTQRLAESEEFKMQGDHEKAISIAQAILRKDPECIDAAEEVADNLLSLDRHEEADNISKFILKNRPESYIANYIRGFLLLTAAKNKKALVFLSEANKARSNNPEILRCLGWSLYHSNQKIQGIVTLERALNLRNDDPLILCDLGVCLLQEGVYEKSVQLFEKALALEPDNFRAKECLKGAISVKKQMETVQQSGNAVTPDLRDTIVQSIQPQTPLKDTPPTSN